MSDTQAAMIGDVPANLPVPTPVQIDYDKLATLVAGKILEQVVEVPQPQPQPAAAPRQEQVIKKRTFNPYRNYPGYRQGYGSWL